MRHAPFVLAASLLCGTPALDAAQASSDQAAAGEAIFTRDCASCHVPAAVRTPELAEAPTLEVLRGLEPEAIVTALTIGTMRIVGAVIDLDERRAVAQFLTGRAVEVVSIDPTVGRCAPAGTAFDRTAGPSWNGWSPTAFNARFQPREQGGLTAADLPRLTLRWAFGFPDVVAARSQPTVAGGRLFVGSESGATYALDAKSGCIHWIYRAGAGVRTSVVVGPREGPLGGALAYFADLAGFVYAVDATTGAEVWVRQIEDHPGVRITGSPTLHEGRLYVATAGLGEEGQGGRPQYECCTFRGSVTALDAQTGEVFWTSYAIPEEPQPRAVNSEGVQTWGPSGAGIWSAPTIDAKRGNLYIATGNGYSDPPQPTTDAVLAMDLATGAIKWSYQATPSDVWTMGCQPKNPDNPNCPEQLGPDLDFSASPALVTDQGGRDLLLIPQKSGMTWAVDPEDGTLVWQYRAGQGSGLGGIWGLASDGERAYIGVGDFLTPTPGGIRAVTLDGREAWSIGPQKPLCGGGRGCSASQGAAVTAIPGAVLSGSLDGGMRAYSAEDGTVLWQFDTNRDFETVNGVKANGASLDGPGAVAADGMLYFNSGYGGVVGRAGNVLLAFGVD